jgi:hypothetical protein
MPAYGSRCTCMDIEIHVHLYVTPRLSWCGHGQPQLRAAHAGAPARAKPPSSHSVRSSRVPCCHRQSLHPPRIRAQRGRTIASWCCSCVCAPHTACAPSTASSAAGTSSASTPTPRRLTARPIGVGRGCAPAGGLARLHRQSQSRPTRAGGNVRPGGDCMGAWDSGFTAWAAAAGRPRGRAWLRGRSWRARLGRAHRRRACPAASTRVREARTPRTCDDDAHRSVRSAVMGRDVDRGWERGREGGYVYVIERAKRGSAVRGSREPIEAAACGRMGSGLASLAPACAAQLQ